MEVWLELQPGPCWQPTSTFQSLAVLVANGNPQDPLSLVQRSRECLDQVGPPAPAIPEAVSGAITRGYLAKEVDASKTSWVVIHLYASTGCPPGPPLLCLLSEPIPPDGKQSRVKMGAVCGLQPPAPPSPEFQRCMSLAMP